MQTCKNCQGVEHLDSGVMTNGPNGPLPGRLKCIRTRTHCDLGEDGRKGKTVKRKEVRSRRKNEQQRNG